MQTALTASRDACQQKAICLDFEQNIGLQGRCRAQKRPALQGGQTLLNLTKMLGLGACMTLALGTAAMPQPASATEQKSALPAAFDAGEKAIKIPAQRWETSAMSANDAAPVDPLEAIVTVPPAEANQADLQRQIILTIPLTNPTTRAGSEDDKPVSRELTDYMEFEDMRVPVWIVDTILRASQMTGADPVYMMALADKESSFLPGNKASTSSAVGLFQFITSTWLEVVRSFGPAHGLNAEAQAIERIDGKLAVTDETMREHILGLRRNPYISSLMAAEMMKRDKAMIEARLGRKLNRSEFYMSHFFGVDSASKFIALVDDTPKKSAPAAFPAAAKSNKSLFFTKDGKKTRQLSVAEVYGKIDDMIDKRLNRYGDVSTRVAGDLPF